jgi:plasmid stability protein
MKSIHIRNIDAETLERLKRLARNHHRSLQGELRAILTKAAEMAPSDTTEDEFKIVTVNTGGTSTWSREEIYGNHSR